MTPILDLWAVPSFKRALLALLAYPDDMLVALADKPNLADDSLPDGLIRPEGWEAATAVLRTIYGFARTEGVEEVAEDTASLVSKEADASRFERGLSMLPRLLAPRIEFDRMQAYRQAREIALPQLVGGRIDIDLRVVHIAEGVEFVPVISARLELDENVAGSDLVRFSIPPEVLMNLKKEIAKVERTYDRLTESLDRTLLRQEALLTWVNEATTQ